MKTKADAKPAKHSSKPSKVQPAKPSSKHPKLKPAKPSSKHPKVKPAKPSKAQPKKPSEATLALVPAPALDVDTLAPDSGICWPMRKALADRVNSGDKEAWKICNAEMSRAYDRTKRILGRLGASAAVINEHAKANWATAKERFLKGFPEEPVTEESLMSVYAAAD